MSILTVDLKKALVNAITRIQELEERLEINHDEPEGFPDGIKTRDITIERLEDELRRRV